MNLLDSISKMGYDSIPNEFYDAIKTWKSWYDGNVKGFHNYRIFNGQKRVKCRRYTLNMGKKVAEDWANLLMNERVSITLEGKKEQEFFDKVCRENNFSVKANEMQELKAALGTVAIVPRIVGAGVNQDTGRVTGAADAIRFDYVSAPDIIPLSWENGFIKECAFSSEKIVKGKKYIYLQLHRIGPDGNYVIENRFFASQNNDVTEVDGSSVEGFENIPNAVNTGSSDRQFVIDRLNIVNNYDSEIPLGIPAFANAIDCLKGVDIAYDSYVNEFVLGKKRIMIKPEATKNFEGESLFDVNDVTFYVLPEDTKNGNLIEQIDMTLRTDEHNKGLQDMLNALSSKCGFGEHHYKFQNGTVSTATEIVSQNSTLFRTIKKHEIILEDVLIEFARIVLRLGNQYMSAGLNEDVEISIDFDDSIIEDEETDFNRDARMLSMGILNPYEFRMKWMNEDEETAKAALPNAESLVSE